MRMDGAYDENEELQQQIRNETPVSMGLPSPPGTILAGTVTGFEGQQIAGQTYGSAFDVHLVEERPENDDTSDYLWSPQSADISDSKSIGFLGLKAVDIHRNNQILEPYEFVLKRWENKINATDQKLDNITLDNYQRDALGSHITKRLQSGHQVHAHEIPDKLFERARDEGRAQHEYDERYKAWMNSSHHHSSVFRERRPETVPIRWPRKPAISTPTISNALLEETVQTTERLTQMHIFLADEDFFRRYNFEENIKEIEGEIQRLQGLGLDLNQEQTKQLEIIDQMIATHKDQMAKETSITQLWNEATRHMYVSEGRIDAPTGSSYKSNVEYQHIAALVVRDTPHNIPKRASLPTHEINLTAPIEPHVRVQKESDPYKYTKAVQDAKVKQAKMIRAFQVQEKVKHHKDPSYFSAPNVDGPYLKVLKVISEIGQAKRQRDLIELAQMLIDYEEHVSGMLIRHVNLQIDHGLANNTYINLSVMGAPSQNTDDTTLTQPELDMLRHIHLVPENTATTIKVEWAAFKLGKGIRDLTLKLANNEDDIAGAQQIGATRLATVLYESSLDTTSVLAPIADDLRGGTAKARLAALQHELIMELNRNYDIRSPCPDFAGLWSFCEGQKYKEFFDVTRWPVDPKYQSMVRIAEIRASTDFKPNSTDETLKRKRNVADDSIDITDTHSTRRKSQHASRDSSKRREKWYPGDTLYPFGETVWQRAWLSMKIDSDLQEGNIMRLSHCWHKQLLTLFQCQSLPICTKQALGSVDFSAYNIE